MARNLKTNNEIDSFISKVIKEANHHAKPVEHIIQSLSDEVRSYLKLGSDKIEVYERNGKLARTCWVTILNKRYVFTYNYDEEKIDLRKGSLQGELIFQFDNFTNTQDLKKQIALL